MRKRSRYRPRGLKNTLTLMQPVAEDAQTDVLLRKWQALRAFEDGAGNRDAWDSLAEVVNALEMCCAMGYLPAAARPIASVAEMALDAIARRWISEEAWHMRPDEQLNLTDALELYSQAVEVMPAAELLGAHHAAAKRVAEMRSGQ